MSGIPLLQKVDAVTVPVPDLDAGLRFCHDSLGHELRWRDDELGQAGLALPGSDTEIVLTTRQAYEPNWLVASADHAAAAIAAAGGRVVAEPFDIPVGRVAAVADPIRQQSGAARLVQGPLRHRRREQRDRSGSLTGQPRACWRRDHDSTPVHRGNLAQLCANWRCVERVGTS